MRTGLRLGLALLPIVAWLAAPETAAGETITVRAGGSLQAAINAAQPGDLILLEAGATFTGNFLLTDKGATTAFITIRSDTPDASVPPAGVRIGPAYAASLATIRSSNTMSALRTEPRAHHWKLELLQFRANQRGYGDIIALGSGSTSQSTLDVVPHNLVLDRVIVRGDPIIGQKRGISLNSGSTTISNSYISDCKAAGMDTQAIAGWNGPGPYTITNNYLEGAGENFMIGGASPKIPGLIPADIKFTQNYVRKPLSWKNPILATPVAVSAQAGGGGALSPGTYHYFVVAALKTAQDTWVWSAKSAGASATVGQGGRVTITWSGDPKAGIYRVYRGTTSGTADRYFDAPGNVFTDNGSIAASGTDSGSWIKASRWSVKNLFELKEGERVLVDGNVFEQVWQESQVGYAILLTPRNSDNTSPWIAVRDVTFSNNIIRHAGAAFQILGVDDSPSRPSERTERIRIVNNLLHDVGSASWPGPGRFVLLAHGPADVTVDHNTVVQSGDMVTPSSGPSPGFVFTNNLIRHNTYGIKSDGRAPGNATISANLPGSTIMGNAIACSGGSYCQESYYPPGNIFIAEADWQAQFAGFAGGDFNLASDSPFQRAGTDGKSLGADLHAIAAACGAMAPPAESGKPPRAPTGVVVR